jgi:GTP1/Obg family GTP-binding protein
MAIVVEVEICSKQALTSLNSLKTAATQLEDALSTAEFGSDEFKRLSGQLKGVRSELKDFDVAIVVTKHDVVSESAIKSSAAYVFDCTSSIKGIAGL